MAARGPRHYGTLKSSNDIAVPDLDLHQYRMRFSPKINLTPKQRSCLEWAKLHAGGQQ
jgi:hypothetical protein